MNTLSDSNASLAEWLSIPLQTKWLEQGVPWYSG